MKPASRAILKRTGAYLAAIAFVSFMLWFPESNAHRKYGLTSNWLATCDNEKAAGHVAYTVEESASGDFVSGIKARLAGRVSYLPSRDAYVLRDGIFSLPLDLSGCHDLADLGKKEVPAYVIGTLNRNQGESRLVVDGIRLDLPYWSQTMFNAGFLGLMLFIIHIFSLLLKGFFTGFFWFLTVIGLRQPQKKQKTDPAKLATASAGTSILIAVFAPFVWLANPFLGVIFHLFGLYKGWRGLRSAKPIVAMIGTALCVAGLLLAPLLLGLSGILSGPPPANFAQQMLIDNFDNR